MSRALIAGACAAILVAVCLIFREVNMELRGELSRSRAELASVRADYENRLALVQRAMRERELIHEDFNQRECRLSQSLAADPDLAGACLPAPMLDILRRGEAQANSSR